MIFPLFKNNLPNAEICPPLMKSGYTFKTAFDLLVLHHVLYFWLLFWKLKQYTIKIGQWITIGYEMFDWGSMTLKECNSPLSYHCS